MGDGFGGSTGGGNWRRDRESSYQEIPPESWDGAFRKALELRGRSGARVKWYVPRGKTENSVVNGRPCRRAARTRAPRARYTPTGA